MALTPVITEHWDDPDLYTLAGYRATAATGRWSRR